MNGSNQAAAVKDTCSRDGCQKISTNAQGPLGRFCSVDCVVTDRRDPDPSVTRQIKATVSSLLSV